MIVIMLIFACILSSIAFHFITTTNNNYLQIIAQEAPSLLPYVNRTSFMVIPMSGIFEIVCIFSSSVGVCISVILISLLLLLGHKIRHGIKKNQNMTKMTKLQIGLFKALLAQVLIGLVCLIIPFSTMVYLLISKSSYSFVFGYVFFFAFSLHAFLEYSSQLYFITPYRKFLLSLLFKVKQTPTNTIQAVQNINHFPHRRGTVNVQSVRPDQTIRLNY